MVETVSKAQQEQKKQNPKIIYFLKKKRRNKVKAELDHIHIYHKQYSTLIPKHPRRVTINTKSINSYIQREL